MDEARKLSLGYCKKILQQSGESYSDEQVIKIRDVLYVLGELDYFIFKEMNGNLNSSPHGDEGKNAA